MSIEEFKKLVPKICCKETSADPEHWTCDNPTWGNCAEVALLVQELFGGVLIRKSFSQNYLLNSRQYHLSLAPPVASEQCQPRVPGPYFCGLKRDATNPKVP